MAERLLLIDDEEILIDLYKKMLNGQGYEVRTETNPWEAIAVFRRQPENFDLVITDQNMPDMSGERLVRELKSLRPDIPVILCSGSDEMVAEEKNLDLGVNKHLTKPLLMRDMVLAIREVLGA